MQTSARMWLESIRNWINDILRTPNQPASATGPNYVDVGVQTGTRSSWDLFKQSLKKFFNFDDGSSASTPNQVRINSWISELASDQSVDLHDSESLLTNLKFDTDSTLQQLIVPEDSASNVNEVIPGANNLQAVETTNSVVSRVYDMSNRHDLLDLMNDPTVGFSINGAYDPADDIITFITPDASYDILRSSLDNLLNSVN